MANIPGRGATHNQASSRFNLAAREAEYKDRFANPFVAAGLGYIDDVIMPHGTRRRLVKALRTLKNKVQENPWKKHDNIPL